MNFDLNTAILGIAALLFVVALLVLTVWAFKAIFGQGETGTAKKGRERRLSVVETAQVDANRKLCLVRRDDVEHLLIIGGPVDLVVETGIRGRPAPLQPPLGDVVIAKTAPRPAPKMSQP
ncbi:flagellar biosynthetic protein FliO [Methyloceanibacter caenitepidi]|uniref:Procollagen, type VI, alpha 3 n=1 Tax=Methyloceanibacter caenitepidi TaxID=1384459 RepID=A0A0A8K3L5_9HYPH|nr:procollagen, type VI, alpha 3 [Methyloceanibacter caenitepidi]